MILYNVCLPSFFPLSDTDTNNDCLFIIPQGPLHLKSCCNFLKEKLLHRTYFRDYPKSASIVQLWSI
jgi:hypothetical protein